MGYINQEELNKYQELVRITDNIVGLAQSFSTDRIRQELECIMQGMVKKLVGSSKRIVSKSAEGKDYFSRWGSNGSYGLTSEGLAEAFGTRTKKGNVKLRKTNFISYEYENSKYNYKIDKKVVEFLTTCSKSAEVKDKERLEELLTFIGKVKALVISDFSYTKEIPFVATLVNIPTVTLDQNTPLDAKESITEVKTLILMGTHSYHYSNQLITFDTAGLSFTHPDWDTFQRVSLPRTYGMLKETLVSFEKELKEKSDAYFKELNDLIAEKGEYIVMKEL